MKVVVHVGPGKTGSSAIQQWLNQHNSELLQNGYYYPAHKVDENGVSSGNALSVFEYDSKGKLSFSEAKARSVLDKAAELGCHTLVLSSEAFIARYEPILNFFSSGKYIFYVRNPLECAESLYNQSVKRHYNTEAISVPRVGFDRLLRLYHSVSEKSDCELDVRLYGKTFFKGGDVVSDFLHALGLAEKFDVKKSFINKSYSFEAVEFKRIMNHFPSEVFHTELDKCLQSYSGKNRDFSLLKPEIYQKGVIEACRLLGDVSKQAGLELDPMIESITITPQKAFTAQRIDENQIYDILLYLQNTKPSLVNTIQLLALEALIPEHYLATLFKALRILPQNKASGIKRLFRGWRRGEVTASYEIRDMTEFRQLIDKLSSKSTDKGADNLRDIALYFESKKDFLEAFRFMMNARLKRPHGELINSKLREYADQIIAEKRNLFK